MCLVAIQVPTNMLTSMDQRELYSTSDAWKKVVYESRRGRAQLRDMVEYENVELLTGHICRNASRTIEALPNWQSLTDEYVLRVTNSNVLASQHVFLMRSLFKLQDACEHTTSLHKSCHST